MPPSSKRSPRDIATRDAMLLNPYPYEIDSHHCLSLIFRKTTGTKDIFSSYLDHHFKGPWANKNISEKVSAADWKKTERKTRKR